MKFPVNLGPFAWKGNPGRGTPGGSWKPLGSPRVQLRLANPYTIIRGRLLSARILVGLFVDGKPAWSKKHVIDLVIRGWGHEASFISQDGLWTDKGKLKPEKSVQVVLLNIDTEGNAIYRTKKEFEHAVGRLADTIRGRLKQKLVIADIQANGLHVGTILASK